MAKVYSRQFNLPFGEQSNSSSKRAIFHLFSTMLVFGEMVLAQENWGIITLSNRALIDDTASLQKRQRIVPGPHGWMNVAGRPS